ncbi:dienelactone hydrolase family protein [Saccharothrix syringae]|uniref:Dienelactone hydrolase family protein n=1 Tax=Saccharothrix syringae TaxID=103733 RepID=A0A5Q0H1R0_SACSY|nr:dienelactone hydrolase family protein [Saccharothrix syringae]QFZ20043.1 dienelactone hydrolase family protein [Saccharothrix syringae]
MKIEVADGAFDAPVWEPASGSGPGIVLVQEIFGLDDYLTSVAVDLAALGYVVAVPELFWRVAPGWSSAHDEDGVAASMQVAGRFDFALGVSDTAATLRRLRERTGRAGVFGFCLGGSIAHEVAAAADPDTAVSFYGSGVPDRLDQLDRITCPVQYHFGGQDPYIPRAAVQRVVDAVTGRPNAEIHVQEQAGHAFHNHAAPQFHHPAAAAAAWELTTAFLARTLPV